MRKNKRKFTVNKKSVSFKLAHYGNYREVSIEKKRFKKANYYTRMTKRVSGERSLWVHRKTPKKEYKLSDFKVNKIQRRVYGSGKGRLTVINVEIINKKTGEKFGDWVRPYQISTGKNINKLIDWA